MDIPHWDEYRVNDTVYRCWPCQHCGARCSEMEALAAVAKWRIETGGIDCGICRSPIEPPEWDLNHIQDGPEKFWQALPAIPIPGIILRHAQARASVGLYLHLECAKKTFKGVPMEFWTCPKKFAGDFIGMWT